MKYLPLIGVLYLEIGLYAAMRSLHNSLSRGQGLNRDDRWEATLLIVGWLPYLAVIYGLVSAFDLYYWTVDFFRPSVGRR